jgi:hypothetical protein
VNFGLGSLLPRFGGLFLRRLLCSCHDILLY